jgi:signal transduction histidine kinase
LSSKAFELSGIRPSLNRSFATGNWRELLLGAWCVSRYVWLLQSLIGIPILIIRLRGVIGLTGIDLIATLILGPLLSGLVLWLASITVLRGRFQKIQSPVVVIVVWLLAACFRGLSAVTYLRFRGIESDLSPGQLVAGVLFLFGWTVLLTYLIASSNFYRLRSLDADALLEVTRRYETRRALIVHQESVRLNGIIRDWLIPELDSLSLAIAELRLGAARSRWIQVSERIGGITIDQVRSASRDVIVDEGDATEIEPSTEVFGNRWSTFFADLGSMDLSVWLSTVLFAGFGALVAIPRLGAPGYVLIATVTATALMSLLIGRTILRMASPTKFRGLCTALVYLMTGVIVAVTVPWLPGADQISTVPMLQIFVIIFGLVGGVAASAIRQYQLRWDTYFRHQLELIEHYRQLDADLAREQLRVRRQTSRLLHGPVQGNLAAMTLCLKLQAARPEAEFVSESNAAIARCLHLLDEAQGTLHSTLAEPVVTEASLSEYLDTLRSAWSGLIRIDCLVGPEVIALIDAAPGQRTTIIAILEEAVTNASRHGDARALTITMTMKPDSHEIAITVENDGMAVSADFQPGFGLRAFDSFGVPWSLMPVGVHSSRLEVLVPLE